MYGNQPIVHALNAVKVTIKRHHNFFRDTAVVKPDFSPDPAGDGEWGWCTKYILGYGEVINQKFFPLIFSTLLNYEMGLYNVMGSKKVNLIRRNPLPPYMDSTL